MTPEQKEQIRELLSEIRSESGMCCSTTMDPLYVDDLIIKIENIIENE